MRKVPILIGLCLLVALGLTLMAQQEVTDLSPVMTDVQATNTKLTADLMAGNGADVAADAQKLAQDFTQAEGFFKAMKAQDAVDMAQGNIDAAKAVAKAAKANDMDAAKASAGTIQKSCKACHSVHRETLPDKTFKFK